MLLQTKYAPKVSLFVKVEEFVRVERLVGLIRSPLQVQIRPTRFITSWTQRGIQAKIQVPGALLTQVMMFLQMASAGTTISIAKIKDHYE